MTGQFIYTRICCSIQFHFEIWYPQFCLLHSIRQNSFLHFIWRAVIFSIFKRVGHPCSNRTEPANLTRCALGTHQLIVVSSADGFLSPETRDARNGAFVTNENSLLIIYFKHLVRFVQYGVTNCFQFGRCAYWKLMEYCAFKISPLLTLSLSVNVVW